MYTCYGFTKLDKLLVGNIIYIFSVLLVVLDYASSLPRYENILFHMNGAGVNREKGENGRERKGVKWREYK